MGKVWNFMVSKDGNEYRQRETLRHTKRMADNLEVQQKQTAIQNSQIQSQNNNLINQNQNLKLEIEKLKLEVEKMKLINSKKNKPHKKVKSVKRR